MARIMYDSSRYHEEKDKLPTPDGIHCIIPGCHNFLAPYQRKYCSDDCFSRWYNPLVDDWARVRVEVMKRDGRCIDCGILVAGPNTYNPYRGFEVHHLKMVSEGGDEFDPNNCITLCVACHKIRHSRRSTPNNHTLADFIDAAPTSV